VPYLHTDRECSSAWEKKEEEINQRKMKISLRPKSCTGEEE
jgi:hypothetical protein